MPRRNYAKIPSPLDIELASNADLNTKWEHIIDGSGGGKERYPSPRERIRINEALIGQSKIQTVDYVNTLHTKN
jgi:hypothetical protein